MPYRDRDPLTGIPPSRHPFQFWILAACFASGVGAAFFGSGPKTIQDLIPDYAFLLWGVILMFGGGLGMTAIWMRDRITGLLFERVALGAISGGSFVYSLVVVVVAGKVGYTTAAYTASVGIAGIWRIVHINRQLKILGRWVTEHYDWADEEK